MEKAEAARTKGVYRRRKTSELRKNFGRAIWTTEMLEVGRLDKGGLE